MGIFSNISSSWNKVKKMSKTMKQNAKKVGSETSTGMKGLSDKLKSKVDDAGKKAATKTRTNEKPAAKTRTNERTESKTRSI